MKNKLTKKLLKSASVKLVVGLALSVAAASSALADTASPLDTASQFDTASPFGLDFGIIGGFLPGPGAGFVRGGPPSIVRGDLRRGRFGNPQVCLYKEAGFRGIAICVEAGQSIDNLGISGLNDHVTSIRLIGPVAARVCSDAYFFGDCTEINRDVYDLHDIGMGGRISSVSAHGFRDPYYPPYPGRPHDPRDPRDPYNPPYDPPHDPGYPPGYPNEPIREVGGRLFANPQSCAVGPDGACTVYVGFQMDDSRVLGIVTVTDYNYGDGEKVFKCLKGSSPGEAAPWIGPGNYDFKLYPARDCNENVIGTREPVDTISVHGY